MGTTSICYSIDAQKPGSSGLNQNQPPSDFSRNYFNPSTASIVSTYKSKNKSSKSEEYLRKNNESAKKCKDNKKRTVEKLKKTLSNLEEENKKLKNIKDLMMKAEVKNEYLKIKRCSIDRFELNFKSEIEKR